MFAQPQFPQQDVLLLMRTDPILHAHFIFPWF